MRCSAYTYTHTYTVDVAETETWKANLFEVELIGQIGSEVVRVALICLLAAKSAGKKS